MTAPTRVGRPESGAIATSLAIVIGLVAVGLVVAILGVVLGFGSGGSDTTAIEKRIATLERKSAAADDEFASEFESMKTQTEHSAKVVALADQMAAVLTQLRDLANQMVTAGRSDDVDTFNAAIDQWNAVQDQHTAIETQLEAIIGAA